MVVGSKPEELLIQVLPHRVGNVEIFQMPP